VIATPLLTMDPRASTALDRGIAGPRIGLPAPGGSPVVLTLVHREPPQQVQEVAHLIRESERRSGALTTRISILQLKGLEGRRPPTIGVLAERLQIRHHSVVELVDRLARRGMVARRRDTRDRRGVVVELRAKGQAVLRRLALQSLAELETQGPALVSVLRRLIPRSTRRRPGRARRGDPEEGSALTAGTRSSGPPAFRRAQGRLLHGASERREVLATRRVRRHGSPRRW
jgi:DNA-binding MarR family transcriptional regulator